MNLLALHKAILEKDEPDISLCTYCSEPIHEGSCIEPTSDGVNFFFSIGKYYIEETEQDHISHERS
jgi:hypothetical protein